MSKKLQLSIAEPCHENWDTMSPADKGKFCGSCQKQVIDFSEMADYEIAKFFKKPSTGSVCGRFMADQLDRAITIPVKRIPWFNYFFSILLPAVFLSKASAQSTQKAQVADTADTCRVPVGNEYRTLGLVMPSQIKPVPKTAQVTIGKPIQKVAKTVLGMILHNETRKSVPAASVYLVKSGLSVFADKYGRFTAELNKGDVIIVSADGMQDQEVVIGTDNRLIVRMKKAEAVPVIAGKIAVHHL